MTLNRVFSLKLDPQVLLEPSLPRGYVVFDAGGQGTERTQTIVQCMDVLHRSGYRVQRWCSLCTNAEKAESAESNVSGTSYWLPTLVNGIK